MAETMSDKELRQELISFGEVNIGPITAATRALYVKKLNHYKARAKVPGKKGYAATVSKKLLGFSSDESGDEAGQSRSPSRRRGRPAKSTAKDAPEPRAPIPTYDSVPRRRQQPNTELRRRPLRPSSRRSQPQEQDNGEDEAEDDGGEGDSMAATSPYASPSASASAMQSFNAQTSINTTFTVDDTIDSPHMPSHEPFDSSDSDFDPLSSSRGDDCSRNIDVSFPRTSTQKSTQPQHQHQHDRNNKPPPPGRRVFPPATTSHAMSSPYPTRANDQLTTIPLQPTPARPSHSHSHSNKVHSEADTTWAHYISMFLLVLAGLFFVCLGFMYITMMMKTNASEQDTVGANFMLCESDSQAMIEAGSAGAGVVCFTQEEVEAAKPVIRQMSDVLRYRAGDVECGGGGKDVQTQPMMAYDDLKQVVSEAVPVESAQERRVYDVALKLVASNPDWQIKLYDSVEELMTAVDVGTGHLTVHSLESSVPYLTLMCRLSKSLTHVLNVFVILFIVAVVVTLLILIVRWRLKKQEQQEAEIYELVEKIIDILTNHSATVLQQSSSSGGDGGVGCKLQPYLAIPHVRDMLIAPPDRRRRQELWEKACQYLSANESRVRVETQKIQGEEFAVWRWLQQTHTNGSKVWQGQACGEKESGMILPRKCHTPCLKVRNMFDLDIEFGDEWHVPIQDAILEKCGTNHRIVHMAVDKTSREGCVFLKCATSEAAGDAFRALQAWWFDGKLVTVKFLRLERYHERFPDAVHHTSVTLRPSNDSLRSLSQPFHRSIIESS